MWQRFMKPIFSRGRCYDDTLPVLRTLQSKGFKTAIVSNTPWGSPATLWREEIARLGLNKYLETAVFCRDVGWRKPSRQIFKFALERLSVSANDSVFVGDDLRWDIMGARAVEIHAIHINRQEATNNEEDDTIQNLYELLDRL